MVGTNRFDDDDAVDDKSCSLANATLELLWMSFFLLLYPLLKAYGLEAYRLLRCC